MDPRLRQLLEPRTRVDRAGGRITLVLWTVLWVGIFLVVGDALASWTGAGPLVRWGLPAILSAAWIALVVTATRSQARRERRVREEFTE